MATTTLETSQTFLCGVKTHYGNIELYRKYGIDNYERHLAKCRACRVILGLSKQHKGFTQKEVAQIFQQLDAYRAESGTGNFRTCGDGFLWHYNSIEAIKTNKGKIISNVDCYGGGFAYCTKPTRVDASVNLTLLLNAVSRKELRDIEILDIDRETDTVLFKIGKRYFLNATDNQRFIAELVKPCKTIREAYESMKPTLAKDATERHLNVQRQGDLFFIPTTLTDKDVNDIEKTKYEQHETTTWQNEKNTWKTLEFPEITFPANPETETAPLTTNHHATRVARYKQFIVVKGTVRHRQHSMLRLGNVWHIVERNNVKNAWSNSGYRD